jgi:hypothetical protein
MKNDRICGYLFPFEDAVPTPINALFFVESASGNRVHVCASHEQVYALFVACPDTTNEVWDTLRDELYESRLPVWSAFDPIVIGGWAGGLLVASLVGDQLIDERTLEMFTQEVTTTLSLIVPDEEEEGDQAILMTMDEGCVFSVWILSSRADVFACLAQAKSLAEPADYEDTLKHFSSTTRKMAETDASRPPVRIEGYAAALMTTIFFCLDEQQCNAS